MKLCGKFIMFGLGLLIWSGSVGAVGLDRNLAKYFNVCPPNLSNADTAICLGKQVVLADADLNKVWQQVLEMISQTSEMPEMMRTKWERKLVEGQGFWVKYKETECRQSMPLKYWKKSLEPVAVRELSFAAHCRANQNSWRLFALMTLSLENILWRGS